MRPATLPALPASPLRLRALELADAPAWLAFAAEPAVQRYTSMEVRGIDDLLPVIQRGLAPEPGSPIHFAIEHRAQGVLVGVAGFHTISPLNRTAEITYSLAPALWGQGHASAVCAALSRWGFEDQGWLRIQATVLEPNIGSLKVLQHCGYRFEGRLRNFRLVRGEPREYLLYSLVPGDLAASSDSRR